MEGVQINKANRNKIEQHLPSLLIPYPTSGSDPLYQKKRTQISQLKRNQPVVYNGFMGAFSKILNELDTAAEQAGFMHVGFDEKGNLIRYEKKR